MMLGLPTDVRGEMERHARETYPQECCGFLIGISGPPRTVRRALRLANQCTDRAHDRYEIDPLDWIRVERTLQEPEQVVGVYHSHPDHPARPSEFDRAHAHPNMSYVIIAVRTGEIEALQSWELHPRSLLFEEETVLEMDASHATHWRDAGRPPVSATSEEGPQ